MNRGEKLKARRHRKALERAKYSEPKWTPPTKLKKAAFAGWRTMTVLKAIRL